MIVFRWSRAATIAIVVFIVAAGAACEARLNADEFIANTTGGAQGEIKASLARGLSNAEKAAIASYVADLQPLAIDTAGLLDEMLTLRSSTRMFGVQVAGGYRTLAQRAADIGVEMRRLEPPAALAAAHRQLIGCYDELASVAGAYADAFAKADVPSVQRLEARSTAAHRHLLAAREQLEHDSVPLFQAAKRLPLARWN